MKGDNITEDNVSANGGYWYGVTGGDTYIDSGIGDMGTATSGQGTIAKVDNLLDAASLVKDSLKGVAETVGKVHDIVNEKTETADGTVSLSGDTGLHLQNYDKNWIRYYGAVGGNLAVNTGLKGHATVGISFLKPNVIKESPDEIEIIRNGNINNTLKSGSVIGGIGGNGAVALGNIQADLDDYTYDSISADVNITLDGKTSTTVNGDVATNAGKDANLIGWMNGGLAAGLGGTAASTINGNSTLTIDGTGRGILGGADEKPGADDILPQVTTALNVMKGSGVNAIGVMGGGTAATTLGGTATSTVTGTSTVNIYNANVLGAVGGGMAASIDATDIGDVLADKLDPTGNHPPVGNDEGTADVSGKQLESWLGTNLPDSLKITAHNVNQGGRASSVTGDTYVTVTGDSTALGVLGGGAAVATHTYIGKTGENAGKVVGASHASAAAGKATITVNLPDKLQDGGKADFMGALSGLKNGIATDTTQADVLKDMANKGAVGAVFGGGASLAYGSVATTGYEYNAENVTGAEAKSETAGTDINLVNGYAAGVMGGGIAGTRGNAYAESAMTDTVNINIGNFAETLSSDSAEAVGVFGNGLAYYTGSSNGGKNTQSGQALVTAKDTNINVAGMADGLIGGGMAIDDSQADMVNAKVQTTGTASINVYDGAKVSAINLDALYGLVGNVPENTIDMGSYVDGVKAAAGDAAIAAGGIALGGGASSEVSNAVVNIAGGEVTGNVYGGGVAAYGYAGQDSAANGGSRVDTSTINLTGGKVDGNVYAGGAVATKTSTGADVYSNYDKASATVGTSTVNLAGTDVTGVLYGTGTVDQKVVEETDTTAAQAAVDDSTLNLIGENTLSNVTENGQESSKIQKFDNVNAAAGSVTKVTGLTASTGKALIDGGKVTVADSAKLDISALEKDSNPYHIAANTATDSTFWSDEQFVYDRTEGFATGNTTTESDKTAYDVTYKGVADLTDEEKAQAADSMAGALHAGPLQPTIQDAYNKNWDTSKGLTAGGKQFFSDWSKDQTGAAYGRGVMIGEDAAVTGNTVSIARDMADNVMQRLSFTDDYVQDAGWVNNDGGIWAKYIHRKYETDGMGSSFGGIHSSTDYDGAIVGVDFQKSGKFQSGIAFHYGSGDGDGVISHNDYDAWGFTLYGSMKDEEAHTNLMADIGYVTSDNDIDGTVAGKHMSADRDVDAWTIGLRGEKEYVFGQNQLVPYVGLRYMSVNPARYSVYYDGQKAFNADADNQNLWLLPIGVSFRNETKTDAGWRITPKLDLSYIWAFGDTDTDMTIDMGGVGSGLYYDVMDDNSWLASLGVEASKDVWSFGVGYGYQKGDDTKNKTWYVNASYAF